MLSLICNAAVDFSLDGHEAAMFVANMYNALRYDSNDEKLYSAALSLCSKSKHTIRTIDGQVQAIALSYAADQDHNMVDARLIVSTAIGGTVGLIALAALVTVCFLGRWGIFHTMCPCCHQQKKRSRDTKNMIPLQDQPSEIRYPDRVQRRDRRGSSSWVA